MKHVVMMKHIVMIALVSGIMTLCGCSTENASEPPQKIPAITLSPADKENLLAFQKDILNTETLADRAVKLAGDELKNVIKGGEASLNLPDVIARAKAECRRAGESLANKTVPETLPPEMKKLLNQCRTGLIAAYAAYAESYDAIGSFVTDKNPMALLEYRKKYAQAQDLFAGASDKLKTIMTSAGVSP